MNSFIIRMPKGDRVVGPGEPCFIIAEMSANHEQDFEIAVQTIHAMKNAGADAVKMQTYTPDDMTLNCDKEWFRVGGENNPDVWKGKTFYDLYQEALTPWEWHAKLQKITEDLGMVFFSAGYAPETIDLLETIDPPCYKIASYEANDDMLLKRVAETKKPVILSVGFASFEEIEHALSVLKNNGAKDISVLYCVTSYADTPQPQETNLSTMLDIAEKFDVPIGFSDNNNGIEIPILAADMGACLIEKHFVLKSNNETALDGNFSLQEDEFKQMVETIRQHEIIKGKVNYGTQNDSEVYNKQFRRSLFVSKDIKKGEQFSSENVRSVRPAYGLAPREYELILGKVATQDIDMGTPLSWNLIV
jgi:pseudaminic acid synthase